MELKCRECERPCESQKDRLAHFSNSLCAKCEADYFGKMEEESRCLGCCCPGQYGGYFCSNCLGNKNRRHTNVLMEGYAD